MMIAKYNELKEDVGENRLACIISAFLTSVLFILIYAKLRLYPFGDLTLLYVDGDQYAALIRTLADTIASGESILYTFRSVLGSGMIPTAAYYCMSPFTLLLFFFPENLVGGIHFVACCKYIAASLTFCVLLNARYEGRPLLKGVFSACYAYIGYMVFFAWNLSSMDGVIALPLLALGLTRLIDEGKIALYVASLAYAVITNFYIGFMLCIASLIMYVAYLLYYKEDFIAALRQTIRRYVFASLCGVGLTAFFLLPVVFNLPSDRPIAASDSVRFMYANFRLTDFLSMFFTGRMDEQATNRPVVFIGILPLLLVILFFFRKDVPNRKKWIVFSVTGLFLFSFWNSALNIFWHGMSFNYWYNYRYSFILSFLLLTVAFDMAHTFTGAEYLFYPALFFTGILHAYTINESQDAFYAEDIVRDLILFAAGFLAVYLLKKRHDAGTVPSPKKTYLMTALLCVLMLANVYRNGVTVMWNDVTESERASEFLAEKEEIEAAMALIDDDSLYRMEKTFHIGRSDAFLLGYNGVSNYASTENVTLLEAIRTYGIQHGWKWGFYNQNAPFATDVLLGMKYILSKKTMPQKPLTEAYLEGDIHVYENPYALPLFMAADTLPVFTLTDDPFVRLNKIYTSLSRDAGGSVFSEVKCESTRQGTTFYKSFVVGTAEAGLPLYLSMPTGNQVVTVYVDEVPVALDVSPEQEVYYLGTFPRDTVIHVSILSNNAYFDEAGTVIAAEHTDRVISHAQASAAQVVSIEKRNNANLTITCNMEQAGYLASSVPYDKAWQISVDGVRTEAETFMELFLAVPLEAGEHTIHLTYKPRGFAVGVAITILSALALRFCAPCWRMIFKRPSDPANQPAQTDETA